MKRILITSGWLRSSYAVLRNLKKFGYEVFVADAFLLGMSQFSFKKSGFDKYVSHYDCEETFVSDISRICKKRSIDVLIPSHDETEILSKYKSKLPSHLSILFPDFEKCLNFNNKAVSYDIASSLGVPVPKRLTYSIDNLRDKLDEFHTNYFVIKLLKGNSSKGVFYSHGTKETYSKVLNLIKDYNLTPDRYPQIEEHVKGEGWGASFLYFQGEMVASFIHRRLREKLKTGGTSTLREQAYNKDLEFFGKQILSSVNWNGFAMCEFKVCPNTKKVWFIEVNPRLWGSLPLSIDAGIDFPYFAVLCALQQPELAKKKFKRASLKKGWRNRWLLGDTVTLLKYILKLDFESFRAHRFDASYDALDDWHIDDPLVFFGQFFRYLSTAVRYRSLNASRAGMVK